MAEAMAEQGAAGCTVSVADVIERAGVSRAAFRDQFADREACLLATFDLGVERVGPPMVAAYEAEPRWLDGIKAALVRLLGFLEDEPALGAVCVLYVMGGGAVVLRRRAQVLGMLAAAIDRGRALLPAGRQQPPPMIAEGVVGGVLAIIQNRLLPADERPAMIELFGPLVSTIVLPYLGPAVARREMTRPAPTLGAHRDGLSLGAGETAFREAAGARLTYRTARVLTAIGDYPGASNREVGERAGIVDQGQISKLLARLLARGLIAKRGEGRARGAPNSWQLTALGEALVEHASVRSKALSPKRG